MRSSKFVNLSIYFLLTLSLVAGVAYSYGDTVTSYEAKWHGVNSMLPGSVIDAKINAENMLYLFSKLEGLQDCKLSIEKGVSCTYQVSCNCGKYGCSTCDREGVKAVLNVECADSAFQFDGVCADTRVPSTCGKYGCRPTACSNGSATCTLNNGIYNICTANNNCYKVRCTNSYCYKI